MTETIKKRGGKREGSGAKPKAPTTAIRIDNRLLELVSVIKSSYSKGIIDDGVITRWIDDSLKSVQHSSEVTPAIEPTTKELHKHQDGLMNALTKHFGTRDTAKEKLAAWLGIEPKRLNIRNLSLAEIVVIYEWLHNELAA